MIPSVVASELEQVAADAIRTAFHPGDFQERCHSLAAFQAA
jgi:hypothetical protein